MQKPIDTGSDTRQMSLQEALMLGIQLHQSGNIDQAKATYQSVLNVHPDEPNALHFLGLAMHQSGDTTAAIELIQRSITLSPHPSSYSNLFAVLLEAGRYEEATRAISRALELDPSNSDSQNNYGVLLKAQKQFVEAAAAFEKVIAINPQHANAYSNLGESLAMQGRHQESIHYHIKAIELQPSYVIAKKRLSHSYFMLNEFDKAAEIYRSWLEQEPDNPIARHHLAACTREAVPMRADDAYIEETFDTFADSFDANLQQLEYRGPQFIADAIQHEGIAAQKQFTVLDAGCGTGLCGPLIAKYCAQLIGVDLSAGMLAKAEIRNFYDVLIKAELTAYLQSQAKAFDIILSADTLIYFGVLEELLAAARTAIRDNGYLFFTVEALTNNDADNNTELGYRLNPHGRYSHSEAYIRHTLSKTGFSITSIQTETMRYEGGQPVSGFVVSCRPV